MPKFHVKCNKIFEYNGTVLAYDYNVDEAIKNNCDLVLHYKDYTMTIPHAEILERGKLNPRTFTSQHGGPHPFYKCYYFKWKQDENPRSETTIKVDQKSDETGQRPLPME